MKYFASSVLLLILSINQISCAVSEYNLAQTGKELEPTPISSQKNISMKQDNSILSKDYNIAEKALNKAVLEKDKETIKLGLRSPILTIKQKTVEVIADTQDKTFVPNLIEVLEKNQSSIAGGSEARVMQQDLDKAIIFSLEQLTGLQMLPSGSLSTSDRLSSDDIQQALNKSRRWWEVYQREYNPKNHIK